MKKQFTEEQYDDGTGEVVEVGSWPGMDKKERHGVESAEGGVARPEGMASPLGQRSDSF